MKVKICGITNFRDAQCSLSAGADFLGFVFYDKSPRAVGCSKARGIIRQLPGSIKTVGVFVNESAENVRRIAKECRLDFLQFHGDESPDYCRQFKGFKVIKAFRIGKSFPAKKIGKYKSCLLLFDTFQKQAYGGTGKTFDWQLLKRVRARKFFVSGGLNPENIGKVLKKIRPYGVDVSSGVERRPGKKDVKLVRQFIKAVKLVETKSRPKRAVLD